MDTSPPAFSPADPIHLILHKNREHAAELGTEAGALDKLADRIAASEPADKAVRAARAFFP